jgi:hypothetical protein
MMDDNIVPKTLLAELVEARTEVTLTAETRLAIETMAQEMAREILKQPGVRQELKALALEAIRAAWQSMRQPGRDSNRP